MTYEWDPKDSLLDPSTVWIGTHSRPDRPWRARPRRLVFTIAMLWLGLLGSVVAQLFDIEN